MIAHFLTDQLMSVWLEVGGKQELVRYNLFIIWKFS